MYGTVYDGCFVEARRRATNSTWLLPTSLPASGVCPFLLAWVRQTKGSGMNGGFFFFGLPFSTSTHTHTPRLGHDDKDVLDNNTFAWERRWWLGLAFYKMQRQESLCGGIMDLFSFFFFFFSADDTKALFECCIWHYYWGCHVRMRMRMKMSG